MQKQKTGGWVADATRTPIPSKPITGAVHGVPFRPDVVLLRRIRPDISPDGEDYGYDYTWLVLRSGGERSINQELSFYLFLPRDASLEGRTLIGKGLITFNGRTKREPVTSPFIRRVSCFYKVAGKRTLRGDGNNEMEPAAFSAQVTFGKVQGKTIPVKLYACIHTKPHPAEADRVWVAGTWIATLSDRYS